MNSLPSYFRHARKKALESDQEHRHGAVVVKSGRVLSVGKNEINKTNWLTKQYFDYPTVHAEAAALCLLPLQTIRRSVLYVYRERRDGKGGLSKPCERCRTMLICLGIKRVFYTSDIYPYYEMWDPRFGL